MQPRTLLKLTAIWSLLYLAAWLACAAVVIPICIVWSGLSFRAGLNALWTTPHLVSVLMILPLGLTFLIWLGQLNRLVQTKSKRRREAA
jgi:hypothetical protein